MHHVQFISEISIAIYNLHMVETSRLRNLRIESNLPERLI